ncbi:MAG TPA: AMP-binding protein [Opitutaceae bacterium]|jgi:acyl-[acyl-carrier-protein]-phospholipid O-acyltransferase/long-chain-fatty-acid--[acyl-carrier-protein] ligase|nr:AMP-binding protein [Opitutaceae bacterium]
MAATPRHSLLSRFLYALVTSVARLFYRVRALGAERVPATGGVLLLANHLSYVDVIVLQLACPRPIRFVGYEGLARANIFFRWLYRATDTIPISPRNAIESMRRIVRVLQAGEVVLIFPEGGISRTGVLMELQRGFEIMARKAGVPVVPAAVDGLWGSVFSFSGNRYLWKSPRLMPTPVCVAFGEPLPPGQAGAATVRRALLDLGAAAFDERPVLRRHLGREVVRQLAKRPNHVEIIDRTADRREVKTAQLFAAAAALSRRLRKTVPARRVGIVLPPGAGGAIANLAVVFAGKVPVNLNFTAGVAAIESSLQMAEIDTVITAEAMRARLPAFPWPERTLDLRGEIAAAGGKRAIFPWFVAAWVLPGQWLASLLGLPRTGDREEAGLLFTSGSAGEPKGVVLTHRNLLANCAQISCLSILPRTGTMLACLPLFHSFGFTVMLWYPFLRGCRVVTVPSPLDTRKIIDAIKAERASVLVGAPTFLRPFLKKASREELASLNLVVSGAEKMPSELYEGFREKFGLEIMQGYGLTETAPVSNVNQPDPPVPTVTAGPQAGQRLGSVGRMLPGMTARIVDPDTLAERPLTETGLLLLRGANIFCGYLGDEEKTRAALRDGWFVTGDLGRFDEEGFLHIEGRLSRFSKIGGEMVPHGTVEQKLVELFDLDQSEGPGVVVVGVPDAAKGEALVLLTTVELSLEQVRDRLAGAGLPNLWIPRMVMRVEKIPVLGTGKLDLKGSKALALELAAVMR